MTISRHWTVGSQPSVEIVSPYTYLTIYNINNYRHWNRTRGLLFRLPTRQQTCCNHQPCSHLLYIRAKLPYCSLICGGRKSFFFFISELRNCGFNNGTLITYYTLCFTGSPCCNVGCYSWQLHLYMTLLYNYSLKKWLAKCWVFWCLVGHIHICLKSLTGKLPEWSDNKHG